MEDIIFNQAKKEEELDKLLDKFKNLLTQKFTYKTTKRDMEISLLKSDRTGFSSYVKGEVSIDVDDPMKIVRLINNDNIRSRSIWDPDCSDVKLLHKFDQSGGKCCSVARYRSPTVLLSPREFVFLRKVYRESDGTVYCVSTSCETPLQPKKKSQKEGFVVGEVGIAAWKLEKHPKKNIVHSSYVAQINANGWTPISLINKLSDNQALCAARVRDYFNN